MSTQTEVQDRPFESDLDIPAPASPVQETKPSGGPRKAVLGLIALAVVAGVGSRAWSSYTWGQSHVDTDDAYVTGDLVGISPTVSGTLAKLTVQDGDFVHKGQLIAQLDDDKAQAELAQAEANLQATRTQVPQAEAQLAFQKLSTSAAIRRSEAAIAAQNARIEGSRMQVRLSADTVRNQVSQAESQLAQARAQAAQARGGVDAAAAALASARQAVLTAQKGADAVTASIGAAKAEADRAQQDLDRYQKLYAGDAISRQQYDTAVAASNTANANLLAAQQKAEASKSEVAQAESAVGQARAQLEAARQQAQAAAKQVEVAQAGVALARSNGTQTGIRTADVRSNEGQASQAAADLQSAQAGLAEVDVHEKQIATAKAQVLQAMAAVNQAKVEVQDARLYAPCDGYVVKHSINVGTAVNPGQTVVTITRGAGVWVMANFKETQLTHVREGQDAEVEVDAFPGKKFHGKVLSVLRATGSATTLLPPDNSTGNFTKIVQRVPVKISLDGSAADLSQIRQGMSVTATIDTGHGGE